MAEKNEQQLIENQPKVYSISELTDDIKSIMEAAFDTIWLEGEISNYKVNPVPECLPVMTGHGYGGPVK